MEAERGHRGRTSHRSGKPSFVRVTAEAGNTVLTVPDISGNRHVNMLGKLLLNPHAGLLFVDVTSGGMLLPTGEIKIS